MTETAKTNGIWNQNNDKTDVINEKPQQTREIMAMMLASF